MTGDSKAASAMAHKTEWGMKFMKEHIVFHAAVYYTL